MKYRRFFYLLIMLLLAAIAIYTFYKAKQSSRYPDIYSEKTDGPDFLSFTLTDGITDYPAFAIVNNLVLVNVPNQGDYSHLRATFQHNGKEVFVNGVIQKSGENENDFSDPTKPVVYTLVSSEGKSRNYYIELFDIPVVRINTENNTPITNRKDWLKAKLQIIDQDSDKCIEKDILIKGRGNSIGSWKREKKGYAIKFDTKESLLGLPESKRWVLLGHSSDWTRLRTPFCYKLSQIAGFEWAPSGRSVELILNDSLRCNYFLSEQILIEKNRIDIQEMTPADTIGESLTGGVLFEVSIEYDERFKFKTDIGQIPFMFKNPDKKLHSKQFDYFKNYVNNVEKIVYSDERLLSDEYLKYIDIDTFIRWWLVHEMALNTEESGPNHAKNLFIYKNRGDSTKLTAGPPWDFDWGTFWKQFETTWLCKEIFWYNRFLLSPSFVAQTKKVWEEIKSNYASNDIDNYFKAIKAYNRFSVLRDHCLFPKKYSSKNVDNIDVNDEDGMPYDDACQYIKDIFDRHFQWLDSEIVKMQ